MEDVIRVKNKGSREAQALWFETYKGTHTHWNDVAG